MRCVIEYLHLRATLPGMLEILAHPVEDSAIASRQYPPLQGQLEVAVLVDADDIARRRDAGECALDCLPARGHLIFAVTTPTGRGRAVEERSPAGGAICRSEGIQGRLPSGTCIAA